MKLVWILYLLHRVSDSYLVPWFLKKKRDEELQRWDEDLDLVLEVLIIFIFCHTYVAYRNKLASSKMRKLKADKPTG